MPCQQSQRALDFMRCALPEERRCSRVRLPVQAIVAFPGLGMTALTAFLRDMNMLGVFFYCQQRPNVGHEVSLDFAPPGDGEQMRITCEGFVVRVEELAPGASIGVAAEFTRHKFARPAKSQEPEELEDAPFIRWTVEMVERVLKGRLC